MLESNNIEERRRAGKLANIEIDSKFFGRSRAANIDEWESLIIQPFLEEIQNKMNLIAEQCIQSSANSNVAPVHTNKAAKNRLLNDLDFFTKMTNAAMITKVTILLQ